jgi:hypothetical protein
MLGSVRRNAILFKRKIIGQVFPLDQRTAIRAREGWFRGALMLQVETALASAHAGVRIILCSSVS